MSTHDRDEHGTNPAVRRLFWSVALAVGAVVAATVMVPSYGQLARHGPITDRLIEFGYEPDDAWLSLLGPQERRRIERLAVEPLLETGSGKNSIQLQRKIEALLPREERFEVEDAHLLEWRALDLCDQRRKVEVASGGPCGAEERREQRVFAAARRSLDAGE